MTSQNDKDRTRQARRRLLGVLAVTGTAAPVLPKVWTKPLVDAVVLPAHAQMSPGGPVNQTLALLAGGPGPSGECGVGGEFTDNLVGVTLSPGGVDGTTVTLNIVWANPGPGRANSTLTATVASNQAVFDNTAGASVNVDVCNDNFDSGTAPDTVTLTFSHPNAASNLVAGPFTFNDLV